MNYYFTSDTHLGHTNIIRYCNRPFATTWEMDKTIIDNTNSIVGENDELWHLGDVAWHGLDRYLQSVKCKNINIVLGNHDRKLVRDLKTAESAGRIKLYYGYFDTIFNGVKTTLCHYPMSSWNCSHHGAYHFFGHVHGKGSPNRWSMDVGVDSNDYKPVSWGQIVAYMKRYDKQLPYNSYKWFNNTKCEHYPCHSGHVNCLFCFCPLYHLECPGNYTYTDKGVKDCSQCSLPHTEAGYDAIVEALKAKNTEHYRHGRPVITAEMAAKMKCPFPPEPDL